MVFHRLCRFASLSSHLLLGTSHLVLQWEFGLPNLWRTKTPFAKNACKARKSKVSLEICEIACLLGMHRFLQFVVTGAFRGFKWSRASPLLLDSSLNAPKNQLANALPKAKTSQISTETVCKYFPSTFAGQVAHYAWDCPQSRLLWIASILKLRCDTWSRL